MCQPKCESEEWPLSRWNLMFVLPFSIGQNIAIWEDNEIIALPSGAFLTIQFLAIDRIKGRSKAQ